MSGRLIEVPERVGQWYEAFTAVREELTHPKMRTILAEMDEVDGIAQLQSYMALARNVMANDRSAAVVAAMLVTSGIRPVPVDAGGE
jgi:hypothetical protein